jgi:hypothetical protein
MKIQYVESSDGTKLFSFTIHDYKDYTDKDGNYMMIDWGSNYIRYSCDPKGISSKLINSTVKDSIKDIREHFKWGRNYDKDMNKLPQTEWVLLKDLDLDHIKAIIPYMRYDSTNKDSLMSHIFYEELDYRKENKL